MKLPVLALVVLFGALVVPSPAEAAACSGTSGVTVIVDYDNGSTRTGCAPGDPSSGYDALIAAGFSITYAQGSGAGALCQIDNVPGHTCNSMPPANAYWAYFHAARGGSWTYSKRGGATYDPMPGSVEGWRFAGDENSPPRVTPPAAAPKPTRLPVTGPTDLAPTTIPSRTPTATATSVTTAPSAGATATSASTGTATSAGTSTGTAGTASAGATATALAGGGASVVAPANAPLTHPDSGGGLSWIWGVGALVLLGLAGGIAAVRRRQG